MAESIGFILGEYTIPAEIPVIYITDSNNAKTLQRNIASLKNFTHRKQVRHVKQGIDQSIASHLEYLTKKWPAQNELTPYQQHLYKRGERVCQIWAAANQHHTNQQSNHLCSDDHSSTSSSRICNSYKTNNTVPHESHLLHKHANQYSFTQDMYDYLGNIIIMKVYSHQLLEDFQVALAEKCPKPNLFVVSKNQFADNAATQACSLTNAIPGIIMADYDKIYYAPFSPKWCFSFEGSLTNKGATTVLQDKLDQELILHQQYWQKQGLFYHSPS
jgi:hypothetical protein